MTTRELTRRENDLFNRLESLPGDSTFRKALYRDGVPSPDIYCQERVRVVFVFREPNMPDGRPHDMREEVRQADLSNLWWNRKAGLFAHAVSAALDGVPWRQAVRDFDSQRWHHRVVNRFGYLQIKKTGGAGVSDARALRTHAQRYAPFLFEQLSIYQPDLVLGCGVGAGSPAQLLQRFVLTGGTKRTTRATTAEWWQYDASFRPRALVQLWHPARRGTQLEAYKDVWGTVREVVRAVI